MKDAKRLTLPKSKKIKKIFYKHALNILRALKSDFRNKFKK